MKKNVLLFVLLISMTSCFNNKSNNSEISQETSNNLVSYNLELLNNSGEVVKTWTSAGHVNYGHRDYSFFTFTDSVTNKEVLLSVQSGQLVITKIK